MMLKRLYYFLHRITSSPGQRGLYSSGFLQEKVREEAFRMCGRLAGRLLDVGCGEGLLAASLATKDPYITVWAVDNNEERLKQAEARIRKAKLANVEFRLAESTALPFSDGYFDMVACVNTIFNLPSREAVRKTLGEMSRVLKAGGKMVFDYRNSGNPLLVLKYRLAPLYDDTLKGLPLNTFSGREIGAMLDDLGLKVVARAYVPESFASSRFGRIYAPIVVVEAQKI